MSGIKRLWIEQYSPTPDEEERMPMEPPPWGAWPGLDNTRVETQATALVKYVDALQPYLRDVERRLAALGRETGMPTSKTAEAQGGERERGEQRPAAADPLDGVIRLVRLYIAHMLQGVASATGSEFARYVTEENSKRVAGWNPDEWEMSELRARMQPASASIVPEDGTGGRGHKSL